MRATHQQRVLDSVTVEALAAARLCRLLTADTLTARPRKAVLDWCYRRNHLMLMELVSCTWCLSVWAMAGLVALRRWPRLHTVACAVMAGSQVAATATALADQLDAG